MHYTAMAGMRLDPLCFDTSRFVGAEPALSRNALALLATVVSFGVSGAFLLSLVPDARAPRTAGGRSARNPPAGPAGRIVLDGLQGAPFAAPRLDRVASIPVEKDGRGREIAVADIYAIRANAHYTYVHDGEQEYFCNLSISALQARLDPEGVPAGPPQLHRLGRSHRPGQTIGRSRRSGARIAGALQHPDCARPLSAGQAQDRRRSPAENAPSDHELRQLSLTHFVRATRCIGAFSRPWFIRH